MVLSKTPLLENTKNILTNYLKDASGANIHLEVDICDENEDKKTKITATKLNNAKKIVKEQSSIINEEDTNDAISSDTPVFQDKRVDFKDKQCNKGGLSNKYLFENYIAGNSNRIAFAAAKHIAATPASIYNPLFIYGGVGVGKTHLMQAIGNSLIAKYRNCKVLYTTSEALMNEFVYASRYDNLQQFRNKYRNLDLLLVDDVQFFEKWEKTQEEIFNTYNQLKNDGKQMVFTSDRPPRDLANLSDRLISRFNSGLVAFIEPPDEGMRKHVVKHICTKLNLSLRKEIESFIIDTFTHNVRDIEAALHKLKFIKDVENHLNFSINDITNMLSDIIPPSSASTLSNISISDTIDAVSGYYSVSAKELRSNSRISRISKARQMAMYLARNLTDLSTTDIGKEFGKNHSTVLQAVRKIEKEIEKDPKLNQVIVDLKLKLA